MNAPRHRQAADAGLLNTLLLCDWLDMPPAEFFTGNAWMLTTKEEIGVMIRSDSRLDPATANVLAVLVEVAHGRGGDKCRMH